MQRKYSYKYFSGGVGGKRKKLFKKLSAISGLLLVLQISFGSLFFVALPITSIQAVSQPDLCPAPVDMVMVMDRSGSMGYAFKCVWWDNTKWVTDYYLDKGETENMNNQIECAMKGKPGHASQWTAINPTKIDAAKEAADNFIDLMGSSDQSALVSFASDATLNKQLSGIHSETKTAINNLTVSGSTNIGDAISLGLDELKSGRANPKATKAMILLTDGKANKPNGNGYDENPADVAYAQSKAVEAASLNFKIFTIGLGDNTEINQTMLENIAATTGAQYYYSPSTGDLQSIYDAIAVKLCEYGSISGCKYSDTDNDSEISDETVTLAGWEIKLNDGSVYSQLTDSEGCYLFSGLSAGSYIVSENGQGTSTYVQTFPADKTYTINLLEGEKATNIDFGNYLPVCGNNIKDSGFVGYGDEQCDDGNTVSGDGCSATCQNEGGSEPYCGDGNLDDNEQCDDGNTVSGDGCSATCQNEGGSEPYCGDGTVNQMSEQCDDGNNVDGDNCSATCQSEGIFGCKYEDKNSNKVIDDGEEKLSGWVINLYGCHTETEIMQIMSVSAPGANNQLICDTFIASTTTGEDGCYSFTNLETGDYRLSENLKPNWAATYPADESGNPTYHDIAYPADSQTPYIIEDINFLNHYLPYCGDGIKNQENEQCDDGNNDNGDGCNSTCQTESSGGSSSTSSGGGTPLCFLLGNCPGATGFASTSSAPSVPEVKGEEGAPILSITKNFDREFANPGDSKILALIKIKNSGNLTAFNVVLDDVLPVGLTFAETAGGQSKSWNLGNILPGETKEVNLRVDVMNDAKPMVYKNIAKAKADNHNQVEASDTLEVIKVKVLAETGFSLIEFLSLAAIFLALITSLFCLKRQFAKF